jgi:polyisoprenoid-binding protein YceI
MFRKTALSLLVLLVASVSFAEEIYTIDQSHSEVGFQVRHLLSKVRGRFTAFDGTIRADWARPANSSVEFTIDAKSINTDNERRDNHLRSADFFEVEKFPQITFKSTSVKATGERTFDVTGNLTMHGVTKVVTLPVVFAGKIKDGRGKTRGAFETALTLKRSDYGITWNRALDAGGYLLDDDVNIEISLATPLQEAPAGD